MILAAGGRDYLWGKRVKVKSSVNGEVEWPNPNESAIGFVCIAWRSVSALATAIQEAYMFWKGFRQVTMHQSGAEGWNAKSR